MKIELTLLSRVVCRGQEITGPRLRGLLALLAGDLRTGCSSARLVDGLWPDEQPANPTKALQILVSRARTQLGSDLIARTPTGYRLTLCEEQVDASAAVLSADSAVRSARAGDHANALAHAEAGLALWAGSANADLTTDALAAPGDPVAVLRAERRTTCQSLRRVRALSLARLGRRGEALEPLTSLVDDHPRDEEVMAELLRCESATAGPSAALARYDSYRRAIREDLGADPGPELRDLHQRLLEEQAPPLRHGVLHEPNPLLGRADDIAAVAELLRTCRVATIVGTGGLGKTRLAHAVSRQAEHRVVHVVPLAGITSDVDVAREVASVLGAGETYPAGGGRPRSRTDLLVGIVQALGPGAALLVLDNCEHVVDGAAELVRSLVAMAQNLRVLTTSRAPLGLSSEAVYPLPELPLPTTVELFDQRARAVRPDADLPTTAVTRLCERLDGLPLAVELAAARVRVMSVAEISRRLEDRFTLLRGGTRDAPQRHRTLHAVVDWSWNLLTPNGQAAMRRLSVFPDGFTADAARRLLESGDEHAGMGPGKAPPDVLEHLVDQSLLKVDDTPSGTRFRMLETVREFSAARREEAGETERALEGYLGWVRDLAAADHDAVFAATDNASAVQRLGDEQDTLVHALRHGLDRGDDATVAAAVALLGGRWVAEGSYTRLAKLAEESVEALARFRPPPASALVEVARTALTVCALSACMQGPHELRSLAALRRLPAASPDTLVRSFAVVLLALPAVPGSRAATLGHLCDSDEPLLAGVANAAASYLREQDDDLDRAFAAAERTLDVFERSPHPWMLYQAHARIGDLSLRVGDGERARHHALQMLRLAEGLHPHPIVDGLRFVMVGANMQRGAIDEAEHWLNAVTGPSEETLGAVPTALGARAEILLARGEVEEGLQMWREAARAWQKDEAPPEHGAPPGVETWTVETRAVAVVAHAYHGRLHLVAEIVEGLEDDLAAMLTRPVAHPPIYLLELPICGTALLALAMVDLDRATRTGDASATRSGVHMIALAERFAYLRHFHPTMSAARIRTIVEKADGPVYADAVSAYADLGRDELRAVALAALRDRGSARATQR
ncbi:AfsR/SARP family transcriptional regulator [Nocardiopsis gilva YIM 90087]|uniref:AfsR/SARP family transcriptional regulator n=1 Tax=Nocardiopsis gilva YIM 90087 TaxID=1235441 RepID=A0A223S7D5_9ACTN|nr:BTAD domain-containing putative transcriptional regulator [Nocardiopsis gilva]ASU84028.1 AfsR/SARP family transcriptional regulator [Nocardiopsis gilva YIM 90087]